jgi:hypothetical protein
MAADSVTFSHLDKKRRQDEPWRLALSFPWLRRLKADQPIDDCTRYSGLLAPNGSETKRRPEENTRRLLSERHRLRLRYSQHE